MMNTIRVSLLLALASSAFGQGFRCIAPGGQPGTFQSVHNADGTWGIACIATPAVAPSTGITDVVLTFVDPSVAASHAIDAKGVLTIAIPLSISVLPAGSKGSVITSGGGISIGVPNVPIAPAVTGVPCASFTAATLAIKLADGSCVALGLFGPPNLIAAARMAIQAARL